MELADLRFKLGSIGANQIAEGFPEERQFLGNRLKGKSRRGLGFGFNFHGESFAQRFVPGSQDLPGNPGVGKLADGEDAGGLVAKQHVGPMVQTAGRTG